MIVWAVVGVCLIWASSEELIGLARPAVAVRLYCPIPEYPDDEEWLYGAAGQPECHDLPHMLPAFSQLDDDVLTMTCRTKGSFTFDGSNFTTYSEPIRIFDNTSVIARCEGRLVTHARLLPETLDWSRSKLLQRKPNVTDPALKLNVAFVLLDAVSRLHYRRSLRSVQRFFSSLNESDVYDFRRYHVLGYNSLGNQPAMLTGGICPAYMNQTYTKWTNETLQMSNLTADHYFPKLYSKRVPDAWHAGHGLVLFQVSETCEGRSHV
jgi:hypothetical protein